MPDAFAARNKDQAAHAPRSLRRIATTLGISATDFYDGSAARGEFEDACEMLRIWDSLKHVEDRRKLLAFGRALAEQD